MRNLAQTFKNQMMNHRSHINKTTIKKILCVIVLKVVPPYPLDNKRKISIVVIKYNWLKILHQVNKMKWVKIVKCLKSRGVKVVIILQKRITSCIKRLMKRALIRPGNERAKMIRQKIRRVRYSHHKHRIKIIIIWFSNVRHIIRLNLFKILHL